MMAFNLNKNEGSVPSGKRGFDLSKSDQEITEDGPQKPGQPRYWLFVLAALLIGAAAWYLTKGGAAGKYPVGDSTVNTAGAGADSVAADTGLALRNADAGRRLPVSEKDSMSAGAGAITAKPAVGTANDPVLDGGTAVFAASFKAGAVNPRATAKVVLSGIRKKMKADADLKVSVFGYASSEGDPALNRSISQQRADAYKKLLVGSGIAEGQITALGRGTENPVASNDTEAGRRKNRRVEVVF